MRCAHEFFKPGSLRCARCGEPGRFPASSMSRHTRVGAPDARSERWIADRVRPDGSASRRARVDLFDTAFAEMSAAAAGLAGLGVRR